MNEGIVVEVLKMLRSIESKQDTLAATINEQIATLHNHMETEERDWQGVRASLSALTDGFPDGDPKGHAAYHNEIIKTMEERTAFWKKMREEAAKYGLLGVLGWLAYVVWNAFLQGPVK